MDYVQITDSQRQQMLATIGAGSIEELLRDIPPDVRLGRPLDLPAGLTEQEARRAVRELAGESRGADRLACFAGGGAYDHYIPAVVDALASQGQFLTAYTPYQAEASQGSLQAFFEFQTLICQLTGLDVANASLYEGASALAEAVLMAVDDTGHRRVVLAEPLHPHYRRVVQTYMADLPVECVVVPAKAGQADLDALRTALTDDLAALVVQSPNFYGLIERQLPVLAEAVHAAGGAMVQVFDPISLAILRRPGSQGVDVAVGEGQPLGIPLSFGGPYLGLFACRQQYVRRVPGRLIGQTTDAQGHRAFCLTLQTREQHIRRAKATSNICTNQGLMALRAAIYLAAIGPHGLANVATVSLQRAHALARRIGELPGYALPFGDQPFFREFVVRCPTGAVDRLFDAGAERGLLPGVKLGAFDESLADCVLVACTEKRTEAEMDALVTLLAEVGR